MSVGTVCSGSFGPFIKWVKTSRKDDFNGLICLYFRPCSPSHIRIYAGHTDHCDVFCHLLIWQWLSPRLPLPAAPICHVLRHRLQSLHRLPCMLYQPAKGCQPRQVLFYHLNLIFVFTINRYMAHQTVSL